MSTDTNYSQKILKKEDFNHVEVEKEIKNKTIAVLGYGSQGKAQALNFRDNGFNVVIGQRSESVNWKKALNDGWEPGVNLLSIPKAAEQGSIIMYLLSDAGQKDAWNMVLPHLTKGKTLCFAHGFAITYQSKTKVIPPNNVDVILIAPKGSGLTVRRDFLAGIGMNCGIAIHQDFSGNAKNAASALAFGLGGQSLYFTTFLREVYCNLFCERGMLVGALAGVLEAQFEVLRDNGHDSIEAFYDTVEQLTESLLPMVSEKGMDWLLANISTTAQRGALDWKDKFHEAVRPVYEELYEKVKDGTEAKVVLEKNSQTNYRQELDQELKTLSEKEIWQVGEFVRSIRPKKKRS